MPPAVAAATIKRYLSEDRFRILLSDLVINAVHSTAERLRAHNFQTDQPFDGKEYLRRLRVYESETESCDI